MRFVVDGAIEKNGRLAKSAIDSTRKKRAGKKGRDKPDESKLPDAGKGS
jgi:hypothetical protein